MSVNKTRPTKKSVDEFLENVESPTKKEDSLEILKLMKEITKEEPLMWGESIIGFGNYHYKYESGREGDMPLTGFSPRKQNLTLYIMSGFDKHDNLVQKLGKHKLGKSCLYINKLKDVDKDILKKLIIESVNYLRKQNT